MSDPIRIRVLFFGQLREAAGVREMSWELASGSTSAQLRNAVMLSFPALARMEGSVVLALNEEFLQESVELEDGDEVAFLPPVSGGSDSWIRRIQDPEGHFFGLTRSVIDGGRLAREVLRPEDGAFVNFEGVVRNHSGGRYTRFLEYECYEGLAIKMMVAIGRQIVNEYSVGRIAIVHRLGRLQIGETSVAIVVSSPHRKPAFDAALAAINRLKTTVPIWKKEFFEDGEVWVEGEWDESIKPSV
jgi:molybdopterin converting factor subunit 1